MMMPKRCFVSAKTSRAMPTTHRLFTTRWDPPIAVPPTLTDKTIAGYPTIWGRGSNPIIRIRAVTP